MSKYFDKVAVVVMDGVGCGTAENIKETYPEDEGANSLVNASKIKPIDAPALQEMGLEFMPGLDGLRVKKPILLDCVKGAYGVLTPTFAGKGSPEGHQALMGHIVTTPYLTFDKEGFPDCIVHQVEEAAASVINREVKAVRYPGTDDINGVKFINTEGIGDVHLASRDTSSGPLKLPIYASSESLVQIAIHQGVLPQEIIEAVGKAVRGAISPQILRVIMRPFVGNSPGSFTRVEEDRRDYGLPPSGLTVLDHLYRQNIPVHGIGKTPDMFNKRGFTPQKIEKGHDDEDKLRILIDHFRQRRNGLGLYFVNLVGTDMTYGHPRNPEGYVRHIEMISEHLRTLLAAMGFRDLLIVTSDHGTDPTHQVHTNHTYERTPLLVASPSISYGVDLGVRETYTDVAATIADIFRIEETYGGKSFLHQLV